MCASQDLAGRRRTCREDSVGASLPTAAALLGLLVAAGVSCRATTDARRPLDAAPPVRAPDIPSRVHRPSEPAAPATASSPTPVGRYLHLYDVRWARAEELAATIEPILQSLYGPNARVVPHVATNKLFIYIPPPEAAAEAGRTSAASRRARTTAPARSVGPASSRGGT